MRSRTMISLGILLTLLSWFSSHLFGQQIDPATLPAVEDYVVVKSNPDADTVILALQGGPTPVLLPTEFTYVESISTFSVIEVKKYEMLEPILQNTELTFAEAVAANDTTAALIEKAVQFYRGQGKFVVLYGHSWGAIILGEYLDDYGLASVDKMVIMEGRLSMQLEFVEYMMEGYLPNFDLGDSIVLATPINAFPQSLLTLSAAALSNRWLDSLAALNLEKVLYTYGEYDFNSGALLPEEVAFLENGGAEVLFIPMGMHGDVFAVAYQEEVVRFIREDISTSTEQLPDRNDRLKLFPTLAESWVQIETPQNGQLWIYGSGGQLVYEKNTTSPSLQLDISTFPKGRYYVIWQKASQERSTAGFIVQ
ncbi:hypothetical protein [Lewinella cohaerens]|uniref:hypothetical protein n=1 Tax=Lewinella cohaerens TaxID=70995 RepID=UPI00037B543F|nr:hypothetical protein [Lewinella cohaerens]